MVLWCDLCAAESQVNLDTLQDLHWSYKKFRVVRIANTGTQQNPFSTNDNDSLR